MNCKLKLGIIKSVLKQAHISNLYEI